LLDVEPDHLPAHPQGAYRASVQAPGGFQLDVTDTMTDAASSIGTASKPSESCTNSRPPGGSTSNAMPVPPPTTLPAASKTTADRLAFCNVQAGSVFCSSPSTVPSQPGSKRCGTRCMFASVGFRVDGAT